MDELQQIEQIRAQLRDRYWANSGSNSKVFGKVVASAGPKEALREFGNQLPLVTVNAAGSKRSTKGAAGGRTYGWSIMLMVSNQGDGWGEGGLIGANWQGWGTRSEGAGILQVQRELVAALNPMTGREGLRLDLLEDSTVGITQDPAFPPVDVRLYRFESHGTSHPVYLSGTRLAATANGGGSVTLTWLLPTARYDFYKAVLRYASGATAPATVTSGTGVTLSSNSALTVTFSPGAGTFSFSLFVQYDETARDDAKSTVSTTSAAESLTSVTVT